MSVWPDNRMKSSPIFPKSSPKSSQSNFYLKVNDFLKAPKVDRYYGYFCQKNCYQTIPIGPILFIYFPVLRIRYLKTSYNLWSSCKRLQFHIDHVNKYFFHKFFLDDLHKVKHFFSTSHFPLFLFKSTCMLLAGVRVYKHR